MTKVHCSSNKQATIAQLAEETYAGYVIFVLKGEPTQDLEGGHNVSPDVCVLALVGLTKEA